jgi:hypothetical protein
VFPGCNVRFEPSPESTVSSFQVQHFQHLMFRGFIHFNLMYIDQFQMHWLVRAKTRHFRVAQWALPIVIKRL